MNPQTNYAKKIGVIFPILPRHFSKLLRKDYPVFIKFTNFNLKNCSKIIFYLSRKGTFVGEAEVKNIQKLDPKHVWSKLENRLFLEKSEFFDYVTISPIGKSARKTKKLTVFELKKIKQYRNPITSLFPATPSGRYLTIGMDKKLKKSQNIDYIEITNWC